MEKITFCIPSKNNLRYLKSSIGSIIENSSIQHEIIVFIDSDNDGTEKWLIENNIKYIKNDSDILKGIAYGYNRCIENSTTDIVCMFHADMYMAKGFDTAILKYLNPKTVVSATRIEPPLHPAGKEKIVHDFGMYPEDFDSNAFNAFVSKSVIKYAEKITKGIFAPWAIYKKDIDSIGMHDDFIFHSYQEDSDIFNRFILNNYNIVQTWEALVYHLTCRGGQFQDGVQSITTDSAFHQMKSNAARNYIRKWGSWIQNDEFQYPIINPKYDIAFVLNNSIDHLLEFLEPWCNRIWVDIDPAVYVRKEQLNTSYDLYNRIHLCGSSDPIEYHDIVVEIDGKTMNDYDLNIIQNLAAIIKNSGEAGYEFKLGNLKINIQHLNEYQNTLIHI